MKFEGVIVDYFFGISVSEEDVWEVIYRFGFSDDLMKWIDEDLFNFVCEFRKVNKLIIIVVNKVDVVSDE